MHAEAARELRETNRKRFAEPTRSEKIIEFLRYATAKTAVTTIVTAVLALKGGEIVRYLLELLRKTLPPVTGDFSSRTYQTYTRDVRRIRLLL